MTTMLRVTEVEALDGHRLRVAFNDGVVRDPDYFTQAYVDEEARTVVWPNGLDPAPELLHGDHEPGPKRSHSTTVRA